MNIKLPSQLFCAPMAEITTPALRRTIKEFHPGVVLYSEMLSAGAIVARVSNNEPLVQRHAFDEPFIYQIAGSNPAVMAEACSILSGSGCYSIDINMGCAAPAILKTGSGARLLADPPLAREIVRRCRQSARCKISIKLRSGMETDDEKHLLDFVRMLQDEGADFIALHARHGKMGFRRLANWELVKKAKQILHIPVIGNGDILDPSGAIEKLRDTGCDGIMIGREAVKSPWIFRQCANILGGIEEKLEIDISEIFLKTLGYISLYLPENLHRSRGLRFCQYYSKNVKFSHELFTRIRKESTIEGMKHIVEEYFERNPKER